MVEPKKKFSDLYEVNLSAKELGKGAFGIVYSGKRKSDNEPVAVKVMDTSTLSKEGLLALRPEIEKLSVLAGHHRIIKLYNHFLDDNEKKCYIVM